MAESHHPMQRGDKSVAVNVRLKPVSASDQPILVNYTHVGLSDGLAYVDFGFLEPAFLSAVAIHAKQGDVTPKQVEGISRARVALPLDSAVRLYQQLQRVLVSLQPPKTKHS
ncbi:protein of unknown function [Nitrospira defluvii]|jgi:hypothetical protein|uniref:Uncharacterized protein n=1 Tax=Nitrospira defluvii TaxID=330214 RepID=D8PIQ7_9BACT|nr:protein of unknown function [Nitrospira defluvii]